LVENSYFVENEFLGEVTVFQSQFHVCSFVLTCVACRKNNECCLAFGSFSKKMLFILLFLLLLMMKINNCV